MLETLTQHGIQSTKFVDIRSFRHTFPSQLRSVKFAVTLLHNHQHAPKNHVLVYQKNYSYSNYKSYQQAKQKYFPCSWYLEKNEIHPYEFCDQNQSFELNDIKEKLNQLNKKYYYYGVTIRPIWNCQELVTQTGHMYINLKQNENYDQISQTAICGNFTLICNQKSPGHPGKPRSISQWQMHLFLLMIFSLFIFIKYIFFNHYFDSTHINLGE